MFAIIVVVVVFSLFFSFQFFTPKNHVTQIVRVQTCLQHGLPAWCVRVCGGVSHSALHIFCSLLPVVVFAMQARVSSSSLAAKTKQADKAAAPFHWYWYAKLVFVYARSGEHTHTNTQPPALCPHKTYALSFSSWRSLTKQSSRVSLLAARPAGFFCLRSLALSISVAASAVAAAALSLPLLLLLLVFSYFFVAGLTCLRVSLSILLLAGFVLCFSRRRTLCFVIVVADVRYTRTSTHTHTHSLTDRDT